MELSFWYKNPTGGDLSVYISTDGGNTYETALITGLTDATIWKEQTVSLADYTGQEVVIVFKGTSNYGEDFTDAYIYLDDVTVGYARPSNFTLTNTNYYKNEIVISWTVPPCNISNVPRYVYRYKKAADNAWSQETEVEDEKTSIILYGLAEVTPYNFQVKAVYANAESAYANFNFMPPFTSIPWKEDFNSLTEDGSIPYGWDNSEGTTTNPNYRWCYSNEACNGTGYDESNCVAFNASDNAYGKTSFLKTIPIKLPADWAGGMHLTFRYKNPSDCDFSVYISPDGSNTLEGPVFTCMNNEPAPDWRELSEPISLKAYDGRNVVIVFKGTSNGGGDNFYLDDVIVRASVVS